jgi:dolichol kinase
LGSPLVIIGLLVVSSTGLSLSVKENTKQEISKRINKLENKIETCSKSKKDVLRKLNHVLLFIFLLITWSVGLSIVLYFAESSAGMIPEDNNMLLIYLKLLNNPRSIVEVLFSFGWFYYLLFFLFYIFCLFTLANEFTRKSKHFTFLFNIFPKLYLSSEEKKSYGTYLYFAIGQMFAGLICPPMIFLAILGMSSISDLSTSQVGIRFGKIHISWNKDKTWEGTAAGFVITFWICLFFVGVLWSFIFSFIFLICDILTSNPLKVSDNLLIPIASGLVYVIIRFIFNLNYSSIIVGWF